MCCPHPAQVGLLHLSHDTLRHMTLLYLAPGVWRPVDCARSQVKWRLTARTSRSPTPKTKWRLETDCAPRGPKW